MGLKEVRHWQEQESVRHNPHLFEPGLYFAIVEDIDDPDKGRGRVRVRIYPFLADKVNHPTSTLPWAIVTWGFGGNPDQGQFLQYTVGSQVVVGLIQGDISTPVVIGAAYRAPDGVSEAPSEVVAATDPTKVRVLAKTPIGHRIICDDNGDHQQILVYSSKGHYVLIDEVRDRIEIRTVSGHFVEMDDPNGYVKLTTSGSKSPYGAHSALFDDLTQKIEVRSGRGYDVKINDNLAAILFDEGVTITTPLGLQSLYLSEAWQRYRYTMYPNPLYGSLVAHTFDSDGILGIMRMMVGESGLPTSIANFGFAGASYASGNLNYSGFPKYSGPAANAAFANVRIVQGSSGPVKFTSGVQPKSLRLTVTTRSKGNLVFVDDPNDRNNSNYAKLKQVSGITASVNSGAFNYTSGEISNLSFSGGTAWDILSAVADFVIFPIAWVTVGPLGVDINGPSVALSTPFWFVTTGQDPLVDAAYGASGGSSIALPGQVCIATPNGVVSLHTHVHGGVTPGPSVTASPQ